MNNPFYIYYNGPLRPAVKQDYIHDLMYPAAQSVLLTVGVFSRNTALYYTVVRCVQGGPHAHTLKFKFLRAEWGRGRGLALGRGGRDDLGGTEGSLPPRH